MNTVKIMVVPGKIVSVDVAPGASVLDACAAAAAQKPEVEWEALACDREVRVQNKKYSNTEEVAEGYFGTISGTALNDGEVILILTKIKGNTSDGLGVITCTVNGQEFATDSPKEVGEFLVEVGFDLFQVASVRINGELAPHNQLVGNGDTISVEMVSEHNDDGMEESVATGIMADAVAYVRGLERQLADAQKELDEAQAYIEELEEAEEPTPAPTVVFGRLDGQLRQVEVEDGDTIQDLLDENGDLDEFEVVFYNGSPLSNDDLDEVEVFAGDSILVVPTTKNGRRVKFGPF